MYLIKTDFFILACTEVSCSHAGELLFLSTKDPTINTMGGREEIILSVTSATAQQTLHGTWTCGNRDVCVPRATQVSKPTMLHMFQRPL